MIQQLDLLALAIQYSRLVHPWAKQLRYHYPLHCSTTSLMLYPPVAHTNHIFWKRSCSYPLTLAKSDRHSYLCKLITLILSPTGNHSFLHMHHLSFLPDFTFNENHLKRCRFSVFEKGSALIGIGWLDKNVRTTLECKNNLMVHSICCQDRPGYQINVDSCMSLPLNGTGRQWGRLVVSGSTPDQALLHIEYGKGIGLSTISFAEWSEVLPNSAFLNFFYHCVLRGLKETALWWLLMSPIRACMLIRPNNGNTMWIWILWMRTVCRRCLSTELSNSALIYADI
jgi:hypothetical protein